MGQSVRQSARRAALEVQTNRRRERADSERRWSELGVDVAVALTERDDAVKRLERKASDALAKLTRDEGLAWPGACEWAGDLPVAKQGGCVDLWTPSVAAVMVRPEMRENRVTADQRIGQSDLPRLSSDSSCVLIMAPRRWTTQPCRKP